MQQKPIVLKAKEEQKNKINNMKKFIIVIKKCKEKELCLCFDHWEQIFICTMLDPTPWKTDARIYRYELIKDFRKKYNKI